MKIIFASNNSGKIQELKLFLKPHHIEIIPQTELGIPEIEETGLTFVENALLKARHASKIAKMPAIAEDSGLEVYALKGEPGIYSARYAGKNATSENNIQLLLQKLKDSPDSDRAARFYCSLVYLSNANDPTPLICEGSWKGSILNVPHGKKGFGYDPIFYVESEKCSAAELSAEKKNKISHRGKALESLIQQLPKKRWPSP